MPTRLPSGRDLPRFAGISTFFRFPRYEDVVDVNLRAAELDEAYFEAYGRDTFYLFYYDDIFSTSAHCVEPCLS